MITLQLCFILCGNTINNGTRIRVKITTVKKKIKCQKSLKDRDLEGLWISVGLDLYYRILEQQRFYCLNVKQWTTVVVRH